MVVNGTEDMYITQNGKRLRCGYTTGTCAAAATKASLRALLSGKVSESETMTVPKGVTIEGGSSAGIFYGTQCGVDAKIPIINSSLLKFHIELE